MAKKADLLEQAKTLGLDVSDSNTVAEIEAAIATGGAIDLQAEAAETEKHDAENGDNQTAKAGKRSAKAIREAEEETDRQARKEVGDTTSQTGEEAAIKKGPAPKTRPKHERRGKKYREAYAKVEKGKTYAVADALALATQTSPTTFDGSVELHVSLGVDPRQADQNVRSTVSLPHGTGKTIRVAAFVPNDEAAAATAAGADIAGEDDIVKLLDKGQMSFDILVATPQMMPKLGKFARTLGPRGLMPNPKSGTVATNVASAVKEAKAGRVEYRVDKQAIVHLSIGKVSFGADKLADNARAFFDSLQSVKPTSLKGGYVKTVTVSTSMGPGIKVDATSI